MKKFILSLFLSIISFICFSNAGNILTDQPSVVFEGEGVCSFSNWSTITDDNMTGCYKFSPSVLDYVNSYTITFKDYGGEVVSSFVNFTNKFCVPSGGSHSVTFSNPSCVNNYDYNWQSYYLNLVSYDPNAILEEGSTTFTPVISSVFNVIGQFIPYVVYIGIGILLCTLGFYAIKWLVNWLTSKITNYFK